MYVKPKTDHLWGSMENADALRRFEWTIILSSE